MYIVGKKDWEIMNRSPLQGVKDVTVKPHIDGTLVGNEIVDHLDVVGTSPVGPAPTTSSFSTWHLASR